MGMALQIALFLASVSIVVLVWLLIPVFLVLRRLMTDVARELADLKADVKLFVQDARTLTQNVNKITDQAQQQMDQLDQLLRLFRSWADRANRLVYQAGDFIEGPIFTGTRILNGLGKLLQAWVQKDVEIARKNL